jgi:PAS domain S-box-containing protein
MTAIKLTEDELEKEHSLLRTIINSSPDAIYIKDVRGCKRLVNQAELNFMGCTNEAEAVGKTDFEIYPKDLATQYFADDQKVMQSGQPLINREEKIVSPNGKVRWVLSSKIPLRDAAGKVIGLVGMTRDITAMKEAELKLDQVHRQLLDASWQAGMAQVAIFVLHNVGNVLNSTNVSASLIAHKIRNSKAVNMSKAVALLRAHQNDLGNYFVSDAKGRQLPEYLAKLSEHLALEREEILAEIGSLINNLGHIEEIIAVQQRYAKAHGVAESLKAVELVEDALRINSGAMSQSNIKIIREFSEVPLVMTDRHKVLQILINLISNAKNAFDDLKLEDKQVILRVIAADSCVKISVIDNGVGIAPEDLTRIFNHGYTTRKDGRGFGLHSGALAAKELGGTLTAFSDGPGRGAIFTLELPR